MARRRKAASKANKAPPAAVVTPEPAGTDVPEMVIPISRPEVISAPSPPLLDTGIVLTPTHKKFGKFRCLLSEAASSSSSSSSDDLQTTVVEDWGGAADNVIAEEVVLAQEEIELAQEEVVEMIIDIPPEPIEPDQVIECQVEEDDDESSSKPESESLVVEKPGDIEPSFERLSIIPTEVAVESEVEVNKVAIIQEEEMEQQADPAQDSQGSMDADSRSSQATPTPVESKEGSKGESDTDNSNSSNAQSAASSSCSLPLTRRRSSRIRNLQESQASCRDQPPPPAAPAATEPGPIEEEASTPTPPLPAPLLPPQAPPPSSKPVKVKSRWRRSSELEMSTAPSTPSSGSPVSCTSPISVQSSPQQTSSEQGDTRPELPADEERLRNYDHLKENVYLTERERNKETKRMVCDCFLTKEDLARGEQGCGEDCLNRLLMIECGSRCPLGERCANKRFQRMEYSPCEIFRTEKKGFGLRAVSDVQAGAFLTEYVGEVLDPKEFRRRAKDYAKDKNRHYYFMALKSDAIIDATLKGNHSRFINHSCDPNAETQKWTVNGELRIGFFSTKFLAAGEEVTFDYQFQRYGKEAQRCYCESSNCRGWIGEDPEKEDKEDKEEKPRSQSRKGSAEKKDKRKDRVKQQGKDVKDLLEDMDLEQEVEKLCSSGLKNRAHTLTLCRLMVRAEDPECRVRLLHLLRTAEPACRRLFLDYHGLRLMWSWMMDTQNLIKTEILETLTQLPIPNKTVLQDSKVLAVVERWGQEIAVRSPDESSTSTGDSATPKAELSEEKDKKEDETKDGGVAMEVEKSERPADQELPDEEEEGNEDSKNALDRKAEDAETARKLLESWTGLKEVFRIPKKERIEQMKEHEREADRGYKEYLESGNQPRTDRYRSGLGSGIGVLSGSNAIAIGNNKRMRDSRESPDLAARKAQRMEERGMSRMNKYERRQLFAMQVEEEERARREHMWQQQQQQHQQHQQQQLMEDPGTTYILDPNGIPCCWDSVTCTWHPVAHFPQGHMPDHNGPMPMNHGGAMPPNHQGPPLPPPIHLQHPHHPHDMNYNNPNQHQFDPITGEFAPLPMYDGSHQQQQQMQWAQPMVQQAPPLVHPLIPIPIPIPPLPPKWKAAYDSKGHPYYYNVRTQEVQWEPPPLPLPQPPPPVETPTSSESSEDSEEEEEEEEEEEDEEESLSSDEEVAQEKVEEEPEEEEDSDYEEGGKSEQPPEPSDPASGEGDDDDEMTGETDPSDTMMADTPQPRRETRRREGLVTEIIISPRREEDEPVVSSSKKYREIKERLRRQKEKEAVRKQRSSSGGRAGSSKGGSRERRARDKAKSSSADGDDSVIVEPDSEEGRRLKEQFRLKMASVMVQCLNPYRKSDCSAGRISCTEDFKHLARKLTHFVMLKELKHCRSVTDLVCNDNVKHKARDFVKKYMSKFGATYQREAET